MFGKNKCKHEKLTKVQEDGYQYCTECGKAFAAPPKKCDHKWEREAHIGNASVWNPQFCSEYIYIFRCTKCGIRARQTTLKEEWNFPV